MKNMRKYDVCVVGLGYIGLPTALLFAKSGKKVLGYDISADTVQKVRNGEQGKNEPNLNELLKECLKNGSLTADTSRILPIYTLSPFRLLLKTIRNRTCLMYNRLSRPYCLISKKDAPSFWNRHHRRFYRQIHL